MWKTIPRVEIRNGWGHYVLDLIWEDGILSEDTWPVTQVVNKLYEATKDDKRWDILFDAMKLLEENYVKSAGIPTQEHFRTIEEGLCD